MLDNQKDYDNVKKELGIYQDVTRKANNSLYVGVTAILAWAVAARNSILCLLSYCVIIPVYFIALNYNDFTIKMGTYLLVFYNDQWEKRLYEINKINLIKRHALFYRIPFVYASIATTILFFCFFNYKCIGFVEVIQITVCIILFLWFNAYAYIQKDNNSLRQMYIDEWIKIKNVET